MVNTPKILVSPIKNPQVCYNKAILKNSNSPKRWKHTHGVRTMIKQKRSKVKQAILPFVLETTYEIITPRAGLVLFGEFLYGLRLNQMADKYLPLPKSGRGYKPKDFVLPLVLMLNGAMC